MILSAFKEPTLYQVENVYSIIKCYLDDNKSNVHDIMVNKLKKYSSKLSTAHWLMQNPPPGIKLNKNNKKFKLKLTQLKKQAKHTSKIMSDIAQSPHITPAISKKKKTGLESLQDLVSDTIQVNRDIQMVQKYDA